MAAREVHYVCPSSEVKEVATLLKQNQINYNIVKKNDLLHIFLPLAILDNDIINRINKTGPEAPKKCSGCDLCLQKAQDTKPGRYVLYPPLILLPTGTEPGLKTREYALKLVTENPQCTHVAINAPIKTSDVVRRPQIIPVIGDFGNFEAENVEIDSVQTKNAFWATSLQNKVYQTWAPMYTMFSRGNITEKKRVLTEFNNQNPIKNSTVIDLYAGIGYFALPYALQSPKHVYCWEINPWSVEGLRRACHVNKISVQVVKEGHNYIPTDAKLVVFMEDNLNAVNRIPSLDLENVSHINMGLLPDAHEAFDVAKQLATPKTVTHVHENVRTVELENWEHKTEALFGPCLHVERIKEYAPGVQHVCGDFQCN